MKDMNMIKRLLNILHYITGTQRSIEGGNAFRMLDPTDLMTKRMRQLVLKESLIYSTLLYLRISNNDKPIKQAVMCLLPSKII